MIILSLLVLWIIMALLSMILDFAWYWLLIGTGAFFVIRGIFRFIRRHWV